MAQGLAGKVDRETPEEGSNAFGECRLRGNEKCCEPPLAGAYNLRLMLILTERAQQQFKSKDLREALGTIKVKCGSDEWEFPDHTKGDGCVGKLSVSKFHEIAVHDDATQPLAIHVTFNIGHFYVPGVRKLGKGKTVKIDCRLENLHFTARPKNSQLTISEDGASIVESQKSSHRGTKPEQSWTHEKGEDRLVKIGIELGFGEGEKEEFKRHITDALAKFSGELLANVGQLIVTEVESLIKSRARLPGDDNKDTDVSEYMKPSVTTLNWDKTA